MASKVAVIAGAGAGFSASVARQLKDRGYALALASRTPERHADVGAALGARFYPCEVSDEASVANLFAAVDADLGPPGFVMFNASARSKGPFAELDPAEVKRSLLVSAYGGFLVARAAAERMLPAGEGRILLTGASASVKGYPLSAPFAMGKFALRGMAQSMARELHPKGIHVLHVVIDGAIYAESRKDWFDKPDAMLDPDAVATACLAAFDQPRSAWSWEIELRPWVETF
jgi:NAD(P)-dependent dehydrogenase (short-subunit alcohol dehydrogenase family)